MKCHVIMFIYLFIGYENKFFLLSTFMYIVHNIICYFLRGTIWEDLILYRHFYCHLVDAVCDYKTKYNIIISIKRITSAEKTIILVHIWVYSENANIVCSTKNSNKIPRPKFACEPGSADILLFIVIIIIFSLRADVWLANSFLTSSLIPSKRYIKNWHFYVCQFRRLT